MNVSPWESSLVIQWLGLSAFTAVTQVQYLVRELRAHKTQGAAQMYNNSPSDSYTLSWVSPQSPVSNLIHSLTSWPTQSQLLDLHTQVRLL